MQLLPIGEQGTTRAPDTATGGQITKGGVPVRPAAPHCFVLRGAHGKAIPRKWRQLSQLSLEASSVKQSALALLAMLWVSRIAAGQVASQAQDVLGAHNMYGRGCVACHPPHTGASADGGKPSDNGGNLALWGQDLTPLYGKTMTSGSNQQGGYSATLPASSAGGSPSGPGDGCFDLIACLSCHDGNIATRGMMRGTSVESVSVAGKTFHTPTLLGRNGSALGNYSNDHPMGPQANVSCGGPSSWDCTFNADGSISFSGPKARAFIADYFDVTAGDGPLNHLVKVAGSNASGGKVTSHSWVTCTTCHDQHNISTFVTSTGAAKKTHFFVRGWYDPGSSPNSNSAAQFCRTCHGDKSNEAHGLHVPTT